MENDVSTGTYLKIVALIFIAPLIIIFLLYNGNNIANSISDVVTGAINKTNVKNIEITIQNYKEIYDIVNASSDITLQEKANFRKNYLMFGKSIIGYKVKDVIKEIKW